MAKKKATRRRRSQSKSASSVASPSSKETAIANTIARATPIIRAWAVRDENAYKQAKENVAAALLSNSHSSATLLERVLLLASIRLSVQGLPGYATLDFDHLFQIDRAAEQITTYIDDSSQQRPLNFVMLASPGSGKSHFINCLASSLAYTGIRPIVFNMASLQRNEDLIPPLEFARNLKVEDHIPLLFLDEFDSSPTNFPLLLPLLWDGALNIGQRELKLGKVVIVMAGSDPSIPATMQHARSMRAEIPLMDGQSPKLVDLFSRINGGVLNIPTFYDRSEGVDRRPDKLCIAMQLLRHRFGRQLKYVSSGLLRFIAAAHFRYSVRSIAHLIDQIPQKESPETLFAKDCELPPSKVETLKNSSLAYHLIHEDQAYGIAQLWKEAFSRESIVPIHSNVITRYGTPTGPIPDEFADFIVRQMLEEIGNDPANPFKAN
ncbi:hypothetical protein Pan241w_58170 [Gimesia alba]|uniref:AAA+ ATPase domain-containing protein n=1 Tax=Gimesia alba TaxID=2527973 RepID=A0A517RP76_9PLAN|nr:P-loop NTPase fold protein [Gimesia alba]QDT45690.1 hypothetical protein Pan241w_58170 [Gimesia alba]